MRRNTLLWLVLNLSLTACTQPKSQTCAADLVCPAGYRCTADGTGCTQNACGDGVVQAEVGEACDDKNVTSGDGCSSDCKSIEGCGNGYVDEALGEACDDGNQVSGDGCGADCKSNEECGNKVVDLQKEVCDDGNQDPGDGCSDDCQSGEFCGNGYVDTVKGEKCDDGNSVSGDGCSSDCRSDETCGNSVVDLSKGEVCDDGNRVGGDGCSADCHSDESCGNEIVDPGEQCDDGNNSNEDQCSTTCRSLAGCGDGTVTGLELCDDGNKANNDNCVTGCVPAWCGDGYVDEADPHKELCDTAGESITCNRDCTPLRCGDGIVNLTAGEECDPPGPGPLRSCTQNCKLSFCGDGITDTNAGEQCDDGPFNGPVARCLHTCQLNKCGDGVKDAGEACDDGNRLACGTCSADCSRVQFARAQGSIRIDRITDINDGDRFTLSDGLTPRVIFEFRRKGGVPNGVVKVQIPALPRVPLSLEGTLADDLENIIDEAFSGMFTGGINADNVGNTVFLMNDHPGAFGNGEIQKFPKEAIGFSVVDMSGGQGFDCNMGAGCVDDEDCALSIFTQLVCRADKTCGP